MENYTMINFSGHLRNIKNSNGFFDDSMPLMVNCCGKQVFLTQDYFLKREKGRVDYQIIYVYKGTGSFYIDNEWKKLRAGSIILFRPHEPQLYSYYFSEKPEIYWLHFTGSQCEEILNKYDIKNCYIGEIMYLQVLFQTIITELQLKQLNFEDVVLAYFHILLSTIHRSFQNTLQTSSNDFSLDRLIIELNSKYMDSWTVSSMADFCKLSVSYFSHTFKNKTGFSPMQFLNNLRIEKAKDFLTSNTMTITTVSHLVGYEDPLYFSRIFKKSTGISPQHFYEATANANTPAFFQESL